MKCSKIKLIPFLSTDDDGLLRLLKVKLGSFVLRDFLCNVNGVVCCVGYVVFFEDFSLE